jgi:ketosteroid isomerase-like protein
MSVSPSRTSAFRHSWIFYVLMACLGGLVTFAGARAQQKATDDATFRKIIDGYCAAWSSLNVDNAAKYYAKDKDLVFYDLAPFSYTGWQQYDTGVRKEFIDSTASMTLTAGKDLKVTRRGTIAWITVPIHLDGKTKDGKPMNLQCRYTGIFEKRGKDWLIVHEHISTPLQ